MFIPIIMAVSSLVCPHRYRSLISLLYLLLGISFSMVSASLA